MWKVIVQLKSNNQRIPMDMLRYDNAWPSTSRDAQRIESNLAGHLESMDMEIELTCNREPNLKRWESFGFSVDQFRVRKV